MISASDDKNQLIWKIGSCQNQDSMVVSMEETSLTHVLKRRSDWSEGSDPVVQKGSSAYHAASHHHPIIYGTINQEIKLDAYF